MKRNPFTIQEGVVHDRGLPGYRRRDTTGDTMFFLPGFGGWLGRTIRLESVSILYLLLLFLFTILVARVMYVQIVRGGVFSAIAEHNRLKTVPLKAARGIIFDRHGVPLVQNIPRFSLYLQPRHLVTEQSKTELLSFLISRFPEEEQHIQSVLDDHASQFADVVLLENIPYDAAIRLYSETADYPALAVTYEPWRTYTAEAGLSHILGYIGRISAAELESHEDLDLTDSIGKEGLERFYDRELRGANGTIDIEVDVYGREKKEVAKNPSTAGMDLTTTIDLAVQQKLFDVMSSVIARNGKRAGAAVVLDPRSGEILASVSVPAYESNLFMSPVTEEQYAAILQDPAKPLFNRVVAGEYPPGSTFKMVVAASALEEGIIDDRFTVQSVGGLPLGGTFFPDWRAGGHGLTNVYNAIANSVNTFFYTIGGGYGEQQGVGAEMIAEYAKRFGFGRAVNIDIAGATSGHVPNPSEPMPDGERWYQGDTYNFSIGQGSLLVTPLQITQYMAALATDGTLPVPHFNHGITPTAVSTGIQAKTLEILRQGLRRTITSGTATSLQSVHVPIAGKTGTAQFSRSKEPHSWFSGFGPFEEPAIALTTFVEEGGDRGLAITAAREFLEWYFNEYKLDAGRETL